jgi:AraC-like DNA-binding protein
VLLPTITGMLLAMLQDRKRPVWPVAVATIPYAALLGLNIVYPDSHFVHIAIAYFLLLYVFFTIYMVFAVRQYGRWLRDNYADLEHKEVWLSYLLIIALSLFIIIYGFDTGNIIISYIVQFIGLALVGLLLWRVETLQQLDVATVQDTTVQDTDETPAVPEAAAPPTVPSGIGQLLERHCEDTQLYLQHDLTLLQLSQAIGINHYYLSKHFTQQGLTYNAYINGLRIRHFVNLYHEAVATRRSFTAQQLAHESGFRNYSTFNTAFKQRMGQTVTAWMHDTAEAEK